MFGYQSALSWDKLADVVFVFLMLIHLETMSQLASTYHVFGYQSALSWDEIG